MAILEHATNCSGAERCDCGAIPSIQRYSMVDTEMRPWTAGGEYVRWDDLVDWLAERQQNVAQPVFQQVERRVICQNTAFQQEVGERSEELVVPQNVAHQCAFDNCQAIVPDSHGYYCAYHASLTPTERLAVRLAVADGNLLNQLRIALLEAAADYEDLLGKYGKAHGWGRIAVEDWRKTADKVPVGLRTTDQEPRKREY